MRCYKEKLTERTQCEHSVSTFSLHYFYKTRNMLSVKCTYTEHVHKRHTNLHRGDLSYSSVVSLSYRHMPRSNEILNSRQENSAVHTV